MTGLTRAPAISLDKVEWRVDGKPTSDGRCRFVPYLDARDVADLLDEWVGPANWRDEYEPTTLDGKAALWCHMSIRDPETGEWVTKTDVGVPSNFEAQKGAVSDAFKRAGCLKWGAGRNVYDLPTLWAPCRVDPKGNAWPNDRSLPNIRTQLKDLGYETTGGRVAHTEPEPDDEKPKAKPSSKAKPAKAEKPAPAAPAEPAVETVTAEQAADWLALMNTVEDKTARAGIKQRFVKEFGRPNEVPAGSESVVEAWVAAEVSRVHAQPETNAEPVPGPVVDDERPF